MSEVVGLPPEFVASARTQPFWQAQEALAHTLAYDAAVMGDYSLPVEPAAPFVAPTLVIAGGASFPFMRETAKALADVVPDAQHPEWPGAQRRPGGPRSRAGGVLRCARRHSVGNPVSNVEGYNRKGTG
jgi:hypothetical protein